MARKTVALATKDDLNKKAEADGSNASGDWDIDITGNADSATKAVQDGNGNVIIDTYLPLTGGTMNKGTKIKIPFRSNDSYTELTDCGVRFTLPSDTGFSRGFEYAKQDGTLVGEIGLFGTKGIPEYYFVGSYSDPFVKVDMEGNTTIKNLTVNSTSYINGLTTLFVQKSDATGYPSYLLAFDITDWFVNGNHGKSGFNGHIYSDRSGGHMGQEEVAIVIMDCGYTKATTIGQTLRLTTNNGNYRPCMIHDTVNDKYYLALKISGQDRRLYFHGKVNGRMRTTQIKATDGNGTLPTGYEFIFDPANCTTGMGISSECVGNSKTTDKLNTNAGSNTRPVYFADGIPKECSDLGSQSIFFGNVYSPSLSVKYERGTTYGYKAEMYYSSTSQLMYHSEGNNTKYDTAGIIINNDCDGGIRLDAGGGRIYFEGYTVSANNAIATPSDPKIKKFTKDIENDEDKLIELYDRLIVKSYKLKSIDSNKNIIGLNAEDVEIACNELGIDPEKYNFIQIDYNYRNGNEEDVKYYTKFRTLSYNDLFTLGILKNKKMEERMDSLESRLVELEERMNR